MSCRQLRWDNFFPRNKSSHCGLASQDDNRVAEDRRPLIASVSRVSSELACEFIQDETFPDWSVVEPSVDIEKGWKVRNSGRWREVARYSGMNNCFHLLFNVLSLINKKIAIKCCYCCWFSGTRNWPEGTCLRQCWGELGMVRYNTCGKFVKQ